MTTKHYYKKKLVNQNIEVEYSSEEDEITICVQHTLKTGDVIDNGYMRIHPSYVEPLYKLLKEVTKADEVSPSDELESERLTKRELGQS